MSTTSQDDENDGFTQDGFISAAEPSIIDTRLRKKGRIDPQLVWNLILLTGIIILFILYFTHPPAPPQNAAVQQKLQSGKSISVVFVNSDSILEKYTLVKSMKDELDADGKRLEKEIRSNQQQYEKEAAAFQKQMNDHSLPEDKAQARYEELMQKQQAILQLKDTYTQQLADKEVSMNILLLDTVTNFLKRYNREHKYDYILSFKQGGGLMVGNDTLDITREVIDALNREYRKK